VKKYYKFIPLLLTALILLSLTACTEDTPQTEPPAEPEISYDQPLNNNAADPDEADILSGELVITFDYERQSGMASNQFAVWIENMDGQHIKTLYATQWTARGGFASRPDSIALWVEKSGLASMQQSEVDAIAGATPQTGNVSYSWDLTEADGNMLPPGEYKFFVEGTLRWKNYVLYSGVITLDNTNITVIADAEYFYEASDGQAALTSGSPENGMIFKVSAGFVRR
jgi:hypothetical protein